MIPRDHLTTLLSLLVAAAPMMAAPAATDDGFRGEFYRGRGDLEYLRLLDSARRMLYSDSEYQNLAMLYTPAWNGLVEGPTWGAWWVQNSYGTTYTALPFLTEPFTTFLQNSQDLWFDQMGDGKRVGAGPPLDWVGPDGCLCDAASPGWIVYRQGDGRTAIHDWGMEFTAAGLLMQCELLLISRDAQAIAHYLPRLERCAAFIETRRDPAKDLFLAGPAGNLLAPSFAGYRRPDGAYDKAYLTGLSVTYIAALDRLIEVEKLAGRAEQAQLHTGHRDSARRGLAQMVTDEGYLTNSMDPDGTRHGVYGAAQHGYFETSPNQDAMAFRVVDDAQARRIYDKIAGIPGLRPYHFILPNHPSYDDMYEQSQGLWAYGTWVNGGHWSTCEARMMLAYYRLGRYDEARDSMRQLMTFADRFRLDNPLVKFGSDVYQPGQPINLTYDALGPPAGFVRGLFEYLYRADGLTLRPHIPPGITRLEQRFPVRLGARRLYLATVGAGPVTSVMVNGEPWKLFDAESVTLPYDRVPDTAAIEVALGGAAPSGFVAPTPDLSVPAVPPDGDAWRALARTNLVPNRLPLRIGADSNGGSRFRGEMGRACLFGRALSADEIAALAASQTAPAGPDAVGDWNLGQVADGAVVSPAGQQLAARLNGTSTLVDGPAGKVLRLDGGGFAEVADQPALGFTEACTLAAWICPQALPQGGARIIDKSEVGSSNGYLLDTYPGNSLRLITQAGVISLDAKLTPGRWVHVAGTLTAAGELALYINGQRVAHQAASTQTDLQRLLAAAQRCRRFASALAADGLADCYEAAHARLVVDVLARCHQRLALLAAGQLKPLADPVSNAAANQSYVDAAGRLSDGLAKLLAGYATSDDPRRQRVARLWGQSEAAP